MSGIILETGLLDTKKYFSYFPIKQGENVSDNDFVWEATGSDYDRFANLNGYTDEVDTPLEFALLSYYSQPVINIRPIEAKNMLPANNPRTAGLKLGSAVLKELAELKFLDPSNTAATGRYEGMIKYISDKNGVSRADIEKYLKDGIAAVVDKYYSQRGMFDITPSAVYAEWKQNGVSHGLDGLQIVKDKLTAFYLSPTPENFAALRGIFASYDETTKRTDPMAYEAGVAFSKTLDELSKQLWRSIVEDERTASVAIAAAGAAGRDLGIFSLPYATGGNR
jgi:hypothetical protein